MLAADRHAQSISAALQFPEIANPDATGAAMTNINNPADTTPQSRWEATVDDAVKSLNAPDSGAKAGDQSLAQAANAFSEFFQGQWSRTAQELGSANLAGPDAARMGSEALEDIVASTFGIANAPGGSLAKGDVRNAVVNANRLAAEKIMTTRQQFGATQPVQVVPFRFNGTDEIRFSVMKQAPDIENLVLRGGGAKGVGYPPALVELEKHGKMSGVKQVVGTSAGALTAALLASGLSAEQFQNVSDAHDTATFKDKPPNWNAKYPHLKFSMAGFHGGTAMELVDRESARSVKAFLDSGDGQAKIAAAVGEGRISAGEAHALEALRHQNFDIDRSSQMVTFQDLENLSKIDPGKFKLLTLTGWNYSDKTLAYFNSRNTPRMPIAIASRISMSIPYFFKSPKYDAGQGEKSWVDGGVGSNMPAGAILDGLEHALKRASADLDVPEMTAKAHELMDTRSRTLLMTFDEQGEAYAIQHGPPPQPAAGGWASAIAGHFAGNPAYDAATARDREQVYNAGPNGFVVFHGDMGTLSLSPSDAQKNAAVLGAQMRSVEAIAQRQNQATYEVFTDPVSGASRLSPQERAAFLRAGPPNPQAFANSEGVVDSRLHQAAVQFYEEVARLGTSS
jgi:predicted acylesterase/phospholipase RssA